MFCAWALFVIFTCIQEQQGEGMQMQGITRKIPEYHILFWLQSLPLWEKKMRKAAGILCRNSAPVLAGCHLR